MNLSLLTALIIGASIYGMYEEFLPKKPRRVPPKSMPRKRGHKSMNRKRRKIK